MLERESNSSGWDPSEVSDAPFVGRLPTIAHRHPPVPEWLAVRLLRPGERITWVRGPWFQPSWECYVTHPALFLFAVALGAVSVLEGRLVAGSWAEMSALPALFAIALVIGSVYVLAFASGYFT